MNSSAISHLERRSAQLRRLELLDSIYLPVVGPRRLQVSRCKCRKRRETKEDKGHADVQYTDYSTVVPSAECSTVDGKFELEESPAILETMCAQLVACVRSL